MGGLEVQRRVELRPAQCIPYAVGGVLLCMRDSVSCATWVDTRSWYNQFGLERIKHQVTSDFWI